MTRRQWTKILRSLPPRLARLNFLSEQTTREEEMKRKNWLTKWLRTIWQATTDVGAGEAGVPHSEVGGWSGQSPLARFPSCHPLSQITLTLLALSPLAESLSSYCLVAKATFVFSQIAGAPRCARYPSLSLRYFPDVLP